MITDIYPYGAFYHPCYGGYAFQIEGVQVINGRGCISEKLSDNQLTLIAFIEAAMKLNEMGLLDADIRVHCPNRQIVKALNGARNGGRMPTGEYAKEAAKIFLGFPGMVTELLGELQRNPALSMAHEAAKDRIKKTGGQVVFEGATPRRALSEKPESDAEGSSVVVPLVILHSQPRNEQRLGIGVQS